MASEAYSVHPQEGHSDLGLKMRTASQGIRIVFNSTLQYPASTCCWVQLGSSGSFTWKNEPWTSNEGYRETLDVSQSRGTLRYPSMYIIGPLCKVYVCHQSHLRVGRVALLTGFTLRAATDVMYSMYTCTSLANTISRRI